MIQWSVGQEYKVGCDATYRAAKLTIGLKVGVEVGCIECYFCEWVYQVVLSA